MCINKLVRPHWILIHPNKVKYASKYGSSMLHLKMTVKGWNMQWKNGKICIYIYIYYNCCVDSYLTSFYLMLWAPMLHMSECWQFVVSSYTVLINTVHFTWLVFLQDFFFITFMKSTISEKKQNICIMLYFLLIKLNSLRSTDIILRVITS